MKKSHLWAALMVAGMTAWLASGLILRDKEGASDVSMPLNNSENSMAGHQTNNAQAPMTVRVRQSDAELIEAPILVAARTEASRKADVKTEISSRVTDILVKKGDYVEGGAVLAQLDMRDRQARLNEATERLKQREIEFKAAKALQAQGHVSQVRLAQTQAELESARAEKKAAELAVSYADIRAPFEGIITEQAIELGHLVEPGTVAFSLVDLDPIKVVAYVSERQYPFIQKGGKLTARLLNNMSMDGTISYVAPQADPKTRTYLIEARFDNKNLLIPDGLTVQLHIPTAQRKAHKISPSILALDDKGKIGIKIVNDQKQVEFIHIDIVADETDRMWISGLPDKATIITVGQDYVMPGQIVNVEESQDEGLL
jgi:multidrug efflux system membrane fusion protein